MVNSIGGREPGVRGRGFWTATRAAIGYDHFTFTDNLKPSDTFLTMKRNKAVANSDGFGKANFCTLSAVERRRSVVLLGNFKVRMY